MSQNELITGWVYKKGELVLQRFSRKKILRAFAGMIFSIHKKIFGIKEEEIIFTNYKITSTNKTWILNDEQNKLTSVNFSEGRRSPNLVFKVTATRQGRPASIYSIDIPVPPEERHNAEKVLNYFNGPE